MPIVRDQGFLHYADAPYAPSLGIESDRLRACIDEVNKTGLRAVFGTTGYGFREQDLDFLAELPAVEAVWFWDVALKNIDALYALSNLRYFGVHPKRPGIQFDRFPHLHTAVIEPRPSDSGLEQLDALQTLHLWHYKEASFASLALPESLVELQLNWASAGSLEDLQALPNLRRLEIHRCRNLESLGILAHKYPKLEYLVIAACGRVPATEGSRAIQGLTTLTHASIQGKILASRP